MILVTGATGFLGTELIHQLLKQGKPLRAMKRSTSLIPASISGHPLMEWIEGDVNDLASLDQAFEDVTQVYHCAALVSFNPKDKKKLLRVNIEGTSNVVNLCAELGVRLLHVSSVAALGNSKKDKLITENDYWEYDSRSHSYAISKYEGEMEVWRGVAEGLDAVIVNPSVIIGPGAGYNGSGAIFKLIQEGLSYYTRGATGIVDVVDVAACMIGLMDAPVSGERYILSAENLHYQDFFEQIAAGFNVKAPSKEAKPWMLGVAWRAARLAALFTGNAPALTSDAARSSLNESLYSNEKIKDTLDIGFKPINQTILKVCLALKSNKI
jgi:dihydroflavonol-4-reductase